MEQKKKKTRRIPKREEMRNRVMNELDKLAGITEEVECLLDEMPEEVFLIFESNPGCIGMMPVHLEDFVYGNYDEAVHYARTLLNPDGGKIDITERHEGVYEITCPGKDRPMVTIITACVN